MRISAQPIDDMHFAPYGTLVRRPALAGRLPLDGLRCNDAAGTLCASLSRLDPGRLPAVVPRMERHPHAVQMFVPVSAERYLAITALGADAPSTETLRAFLVPGDLGIAYGIGVWHIPMTVLDGPATFLVLMHRLASERDEEWHTLAEPIEIAGP
jgi:ureidoglycolate lyase